ncbi:MAG: hypothetical protein ACYTGP_01265 [Planctomycetota bacterium]|jgi:hypothetical protein
MQLHPRQLIVALTLGAFCGTSLATTYLEADFDTKAIDAPIGTGGPLVGEPISVSGAIDAFVRSDPFRTPSLEISDASTCCAGFARFEFEGGAEITSGVITVNAELWFDSYNGYALRLREPGTAADSFADITFAATGTVYVSDGDGSLGAVATYPLGRPYPVSIVYDMDTHRYDVYLDGCLVVDQRHFDVMADGIGAVLIGTLHDSDLDGIVRVDRLTVFSDESPIGICPGSCSLEAGFDGKTIGAPIGTGGPLLGEPVSVSSLINTAVRAAPFATPCLEITDNSTCCAGTAVFEFPASAEITTGTITLNTNLWFDGYEQYILYVREQGSAADSFLTLNFTSIPSVHANDADGGPGTIGTYAIGRPYPVSVVFDMDAGTYDLYLDGCLAVADEPHGVVGSGIGSVHLGMAHDPDLDGRYWIDDVSLCEGEDPIDTCCPEDLDGSGDVGFGDIFVIISMWGACAGCPADLDGSGFVDFADILIAVGAWGPC